MKMKIRKHEICYHSQYGTLVRNFGNKYFLIKSDEYVKKEIPRKKRTSVNESEIDDSMVMYNRREYDKIKRKEKMCVKCGETFELSRHNGKLLCRSCMMDYDSNEERHALDVCNQVGIGGNDGGVVYHG